MPMRRGRNRHKHAFGGQSLGNGAAYALAGTGDESGLSDELQIHVKLPSR